MELRLTVSRRDETTVLKLDGRLAARSLGELDRLVRSAGGPIVVDLSNLVSADDAGVATLRTLAGQGVRLTGASPFVSLLLGERGGSRSTREKKKSP
jgi:hypothetical protein